MESHEIALTKNESPPCSIPPTSKPLPNEHEMQVFTTIAKYASESRMYKHYGDIPGIMMTILAARELGIPPMLALNGGISNINGKLEISARLMNALMRRAGIKIDIKENSEEKCTVTGVRSDSQDTATVSYTFAEAQKAGLVKPGGGWVKNPKDMLFARAISRLARQIAPDVIGGCYVEGEIFGELIPMVEKKEIKEDPCLDNEYLSALLEPLEDKDKELFQEYLNAVIAHYGWTYSDTLKKLVGEKNVYVRYQEWKSKRKDS